MARQLRIEYPGAFYHIYSRGNQKQPIFLVDDDRYYFLKILDDTHKKFGLTIQAYCLMSNHYHLSASTPRGGLARAMHFANTTYTVYINKKHKRCGHLFQGRYRSILVEASTYSLELSRYIHLNPVRAGLVPFPDQYPWSSYSEYCGKRAPYPWLDITPILGQNGQDRMRMIETYNAYVLSGIGRDAPQGYPDSKRTGVLGSADFVDSIRRSQLRGLEAIRDREQPQRETFRRRASLSEILELANGMLGPQNRLSKCAVIFIGHRWADHTLAELAAFLGMSISGISNGRRRAEREVAQNATFNRVIAEISSLIQSDREGQTYLLSESDKR